MTSLSIEEFTGDGRVSGAVFLEPCHHTVLNLSCGSHLPLGQHHSEAWQRAKLERQMGPKKG